MYDNDGGRIVRMKWRRSIAALVLSLMTVGTATQVAAQGTPEPPEMAYRDGDKSITALSVLPPGQGRYMNGPELFQAQASGQQPPHNTDQLEMYDSMVQGAPDITEQQLDRYFKDQSFGVKPDDVETRYEPREGTVVVRDASFGVPHVYGTTRSDVMFGAGYVSAEDRLFMMDTLRHVGRGRVSEFLGASDANLALDRAIYRSAGYTEEELAQMVERAKGLYPDVADVAKNDLTDFTAGVNQYIAEARTDPTKLPGEYEALQQFPEDWKETDSAAIAALIGSQLGVGGGAELSNAAFLDALEEEGFSKRGALRIFDDFHMANDPEAPVTTNERFPWMTNLGKVKEKSVARPDDAREVQGARRYGVPTSLDGPFGKVPLLATETSSNALLVGSKLSESGRPIAVFGPQVGYWSPEILMEMELQGPGISSRGVGFPGISLYTLLGRGDGYAWSATSAGGDLVDIFAEKLCNPDGGEVAQDSTFYKKGGKCVEMYTRTDSWAAKPSAGGFPPEQSEESVVVTMTTQRTDDGIVQARGTIGGKPVAWVANRSTFMKEVDSAGAYVLISDPDRVNGPEDFRKAFSRFGFTFNWFYLDDRSIAFQLGGYHPLRARHTNPDLPVWGVNRRWKWDGLQSKARTPHAVDPAKGWMTSWNNKQAPGFRANDNEDTYGPVHRVLPLDAGIKSYKKKNGKVSLVDLVNIMGNAATVDLRAFEVLPVMLKAARIGKKSELAPAVSLLKKWVRSGSHRRDENEDGEYEHQAAIALLDAWWDPAVSAIFKPTLGKAYDFAPTEADGNPPSGIGSAWQHGLYGQVHKDLRQVLGMKVKGRFSREYCGKGKLSRCRKVLRESLKTAIDALREQYGEDPSTWDVDEEAEKIAFTPIGVQGQTPIQWQNRPTFQQVVEFGR